MAHFSYTIYLENTILEIPNLQNLVGQGNGGWHVIYSVTNIAYIEINM